MQQYEVEKRVIVPVGNPTYEDVNLGIRVASIPEPRSLAMLLGIALMALLYWWRKRA